MRAGNAIWLDTDGLLRSLRAIIPLSMREMQSSGQPSASQSSPISEISDESTSSRAEDSSKQEENAGASIPQIVDD